MLRLDLKYGIPFCTVELSYKGQKGFINNVLLDTGSVGTVFKMDIKGLIINELKERKIWI